MHMDFYDFVDGACRHTLNLASADWVLYSLAEVLVSSGAVRIGLATNNIAEYEAVIGLLTEATSQDVRDLVFLMDSQLVVCHLKHVYTKEPGAPLPLPESMFVRNIIWNHYL